MPVSSAAQPGQLCVTVLITCPGGTGAERGLSQQQVPACFPLSPSPAARFLLAPQDAQALAFLQKKVHFFCACKSSARAK